MRSPQNHEQSEYPFGFKFVHEVSVAIGGIRDKTRLPRSQELVLRVLLTYVNGTTGICAVGYRQLVQELRMAQDSVRQHLNALIGHGILVVVRDASQHNARQLRIDVEALKRFASEPDRPRSGKFSAPIGTGSAHPLEHGQRTHPMGAERDIRKEQREEDLSYRKDLPSSPSAAVTTPVVRPVPMSLRRLRPTAWMFVCGVLTHDPDPSPTALVRRLEASPVGQGLSHDQCCELVDAAYTEVIGW